MPFNFGKDEDYWPDMPSNDVKTLSDRKVMANHTRITSLNKTIYDVKKRLKTQIEKQLTEALTVERENIKQLVGDSQAAMFMNKANTMTKG